MKKLSHYYLLVLASCCCLPAMAQLKIGNNPTAINAASLLEMETTDKGIVLPRVNITSLAAAAPLAAGLLEGTVVYNTNAALPNGVGIYVWKAGAWNYVGLPAAAGATLNQAYNFGGPGAGRTITATDGAVAIAGEDGLLVTGTLGSGDDILLAGAGTRLFFNPKKAAFRAGGIVGTQWDNANVGQYSFAGGSNNMASGNATIALGLTNTASGNDGAAAIGDGNLSSGNTSMALGIGNTASGFNAVALGSYNEVKNMGAFAAGTENELRDNYNVALGRGNLVYGDYAMALGHFNWVYQQYAIALGHENESSGEGSVVIGYGNEASNTNSMALGYANGASGNTSFAAGDGNEALGQNAVAIGLQNDAGNYSTAIGQLNQANNTSYAFGMDNRSSGLYSLAMGYRNVASSNNSMALGNSTLAKSFSETTAGLFNTDYTPLSSTAYNAADRLFVIGNGTSDVARSNAMVVLKNGNTGIGTSTPLEKLHIVGNIRMVDGSQAVGKVLTSDANGTATWQTPAAGITGFTLNQSYNFGGPGAGRTITATDGAVAIAGEDGLLVTGTYGSGDDILLSGAGTRLFFNPKKAAFRAGDVNGTQWDNANVGDYSFAGGRNNIASGNAAIALGSQNIVSGTYGASAIGEYNRSTGYASIALGTGNDATDRGAFAAGQSNDATGWGSVALGLSNEAAGSESIAIGSDNEANGTYNVALGDGNRTDGDRAVAIGNNNEAEVYDAMAIGNNNRAGGELSFAAGSGNEALGREAVAIGVANNVGTYGVAVGKINDVADDCYAFGIDNIITGRGSTALGRGNLVSGDFAMAFGMGILARSYREITTGFYNTDYTPLSATTNNAADRLFVIGNGIDDFTRSDAMVMLKNGNTGLGTSTPLDKLHIVGSIRMVDGSQAVGKVLTSDANGRATWQTPAAGITGLTLDQAYDFGGAGAGRTITADAGALSIAGADGLQVTGTFGSGANLLLSGSGTRLFFNPKKAAFRAGSIAGTQWDNANVGTYSFAGGNNNMASGNGTIALGLANTASGNDGAAAIGNGNIASGNGSMAFGTGNTTSADEAISLGSSNTASGLSSVAIGYGNEATNEGAFAAGVGSIASSAYSVALGLGNETTGSNAIAIGSYNAASQPFTITLGEANEACGDRSAAIGTTNEANGSNSMAIGNNNRANGSLSFAAGSGNEATGANAVAIGRANNVGAYGLAIGEINNVSNSSYAFGINNTNSGNMSTAFGHYNTVSGDLAIALGNRTMTRSYNEITTGLYNTDYTPLSTNTYNAADRLFVIGNGTSNASRSDAMVMLKNGNTGLGTSTPTSLLDVNGASAFKISMQNAASGTVTLDNSASVWYFTGAASITLPAANSCANRLYRIVNRSSGIKTLSSCTSLTGAASTSVAINGFVEIISNGTSWLQIQ